MDKTVLWLRENDTPPADLPAEDLARSAALTELFRRRIAGDEPSEQEWQQAEQAAWAAWDAWDAFYTRLSDQLVEIIRSSPVVQG